MNEEHWLLEVVEAMPDGVVIVNESGEMVLVNREMERLLGYSREELLGNNVDMLLPEQLQRSHSAHRSGYQAAPHRRAMGHGLELSARERVTEERNRIARDLHDTVIQRLFAAGLSLQSVLPVVPAEAKVKIERIIDDQDDAIRELRTAIFGLSSKRSAGRTIRVVVNQLVDDAARVLGFRPTLHFIGVLDSIDQEVTGEVAAVVREALSNVARHARAKRVEVSLSHIGERLGVVISDDGSGIPSSHRLGSGLLNMQDRAARLDGTCTVTSVEGTGTTVRWQVPVER